MQDVGGFDERRLFRFTVQQGTLLDYFELRHLSPDIDFVSQEESSVVVGFASEAALANFEARLATLVDKGEVINKNAFFALLSVDRWSPEDRKGWALKNQGLPDQELFLLDVELWPLEDNREAKKERDAFETWMQQQQIEKKDQIKQPGLTLYRVRCNTSQASLLLRHRDVRSVDLPPKIGLERSLVMQDINQFPPVPAPDEQASAIVVLDSGLISGHPLLHPAVGDVQSFLSGKTSADECGHGTHVAGLALYGDFEAGLRSGAFTPKLKLFSGRILDENNENNSGFVENQIIEAVDYFCRHYNCRVFNLSFGDVNKPYRGGHLRGLSLILDSLSRDRNLLFVVSAGNHVLSDVSPKGLAWRRNYPDYLLQDAWRIIEPAPALNVLTVGSLAHRNQTFNSQSYPLDPSELSIAQPDQPSPFTCRGNSVDGAIKPELVAYGGNWAINTRAGNWLLDKGCGLGVVSTGHEHATGRLFAIHSGTSMAAPQVAHLAALVLRELPSASNNQIRALLCAHAAMPAASQALITQNKDFRQVCGYGMVDTSALFYSVEDAVTLLAGASIANKRHHFYEIPVPTTFTTGKSRRLRAISAALAYTPPVRSNRIKYRATRIDFRLVAAPGLDQVITMFNKATEKANYENIPEFKKGLIGQTARSKGTVQADLWEFKQFNKDSKLKEEKLFAVITRNDFPWGEQVCNQEEEYALVISFRDRENAEARLYTQIKQQLQAKVRVRGKVTS